MCGIPEQEGPAAAPTPGQQPGQNQALGLINQMLQQPRAVAPAGGAATQQPGTTQIGGGIAGVASTLERGGIKVYNEKDKYNEWEFLFDLTQDKTGLGQQPGQNPAAPGQVNPPPTQPTQSTPPQRTP